MRSPVLKQCASGLVATIALAACAASGGSTTTHAARANAQTFSEATPAPALPTPRGDDPAVSITGGATNGTLYLLAGPVLVDADVYEVHGTFTGSRRVTYSKSFGFDGVDARYGRVILSDGRTGVSSIRLLLTKGALARLGPPLAGYGYSPALGPGGRFSYAAFSSNANTIFVARLGHRGTRAVLRAHATTTDSAWSPSGRLAVLVGNGRNAHITIGVGTASARIVRPRLPGLVGLIGGGRGGMMALYARGAIGLLQWDGRLRAVRTAWTPDCFSPDGRDVLVTSPDRSRLGLMAVTTGAITPVANVAHGVFVAAAWTSG